MVIFLVSFPYPDRGMGIKPAGPHRGPPAGKGDAVDFTITKLSNLTDKIIPILKKYPIVGVKGLDFAD